MTELFAGTVIEQSRRARLGAASLRDLSIGAAENCSVSFGGCTTAFERCRTEFLASMQKSVAGHRHFRPRVHLPRGCKFFLHAKVGEEPVTAVWLAERLVVDPCWEERAQLLIGLGEEFQLEEDGPLVVAGLDEPFQAALTLIRAADQLLEFRYLAAELDISYDVREVSRN